MPEATLSRRAPVHLPPEVADRPVALRGYQLASQRTDRLTAQDLATPILGLFGEVGSLLAALKKKRREGAAFVTYNATILEELGDSLWYLSAITTRRGVELYNLPLGPGVACVPAVTFADVQRLVGKESRGVADEMLELASAAGSLVEILKSGALDSGTSFNEHLARVFFRLILTATAADVDLEAAALGNLEKTFSRWPLSDVKYPEVDEGDLPVDERLPRQFRILIKEHSVNGKTYVVQKRNGIVIGDRLTDNKMEKDDYRFHDVFHIAYAVHLEWSPVLRSLFRAKRKSRPALDENEDGARAILIEEGIATFVFGKALGRDLFDGLEHLDYDLLKTVQDFVEGFEAERCAAWQWEKAILDGFAVFRKLKDPNARGGWIVADLDEHTLKFEPASTTETD